MSMIKGGFCDSAIHFFLQAFGMENDKWVSRGEID
jgi:hypothetical protein